MTIQKRALAELIGTFWLVFGVRYQQELYYDEEFRELARLPPRVSHLGQCVMP